MPTDLYIAALQESIVVPDAPPNVLESCNRAARNMGLVHALQDFTLFDSASPELLSPQKLGRPPSRARRFAGTEDYICFFVGPPMLDAERPGALVFRTEVESDGSVATPWDSGGLQRRRAQHLTEAERKDLLRTRTMPAPDYRRALATTLVLRFGGEPSRYIHSQIVDATDPDGVYDGTPSSFTYEARIPGRLSIQIPELAFVAVRREFITEGVHRLRAWCAEHGVPFQVIDEHSAAGDVREAVLKYALENLENPS
ncbi:hypothetical protein WME94_45805 [Sorangium sp. So ce429]